MDSLLNRLNLRRSSRRQTDLSGTHSSHEEGGKVCQGCVARRVVVHFLATGRRFTRPTQLQLQVQDRDSSSHSAGAMFDIDLSYRGSRASGTGLSHAALMLQQGIPLDLEPVRDAPSTTSPRTVEALRQLMRPATALEAMVSVMWCEDADGVGS